MSDNTMKKQTSGLVPRLRFPEFQEAGEWEEKPLSETCRVTQGGTPDTKASDFWGGAVQWLTPAEMGKSESKYIAKTIRSITEKGLVNCSSELLPVNSVIISTRAPIGHLAINRTPMAINQGCRGLIPSPGFDFHFIYYTLEKSKSQLNDLGSGNTFKELSGSTLKGFIFVLPQLTEQQKIADCLSSLDALIKAEADKLDALKTHKKGLMQQLFPREGETVPRLRFPEFQEAGEWEEQSLEDMAKRGSGHTPNKKIASYYNGGIKWVSLADSDKLDNGYIFNTKVEISGDGIKNSSAVLHSAGTVILSRDAGVGKSAVLYSPMAVSQHFMAWQCHESKLSNWFLYYVLQGMKPFFEMIAVGNTIKTIGLSFFKELTLIVPTLPEQQKIADCLFSLDALKTHKKGLMQQLFPVASATAEEPTP